MTIKIFSIAFCITLTLSGGVVSAQEDYKSRILEEAIAPYSTENSPYTYKKYKSRNKEITQLREQAAILALKSGDCDKVRYTGIHNRADGLVKNIDFVVECENKERFQFNEKEIKKGVVQHGLIATSWSEERAIPDCLAMFKRNAHTLNIPPGKIDIHDHRITTSREGPTQVLTVGIPFTVKGNNGIKTEHRAGCNYKPGEQFGTLNKNIYTY